MESLQEKEIDKKHLSTIPKEKKNNKFWHIDREMIRFKLHFFLVEGALGASVPFISVLAKRRIGFSASSMAALNVTQRFVYMFTKPFIGYLSDFFHKLKEILCILIVIQGIFFFLILAIPSIGKDTTRYIHTFKVTSPEKENFSVSFDNCKNFNDDQMGFSLPIVFKNLSVCSFSQNKTACHFKEVNFHEMKLLNQSALEDRTNWLVLEKCNRIISLDSADSQELSSTLILKQNVVEINNSINCNSPSTFFNDSLQSVFYLKQFKNSTAPGLSSTFCIFCSPSNSCCISPCYKTGLNLKSNHESVFLTYQYWTYAFIAVTAFAAMNAMFTLSDTACFETIQNTGADFGRQRLWTAVGWGLISPVGGLLADFTHDYIASFAFSSILWVIALWNIIRLDLIQPNFSKNILKDISSLYASGELIAFQILVLLHGISIGFIWFYLIWFLADIGGSSFLCGITQFMQSFGDIPFMFFSTRILDKIGHFSVLSLSLLSYFVRFFCYSYLVNPWYIVPVEAIHGLTYGIFNNAVASYAKMNARPGTEATTQAILFATHEGLGAGIGNILAGIGFDYLGSRLTYFYASLFAAFSTVISVMFALGFRLKKRNFKVSTSNAMNSPSENKMNS